MRKLFLPPGHSQWWLLSPGVMLYYDCICMLRRDFEETISKESMSSYHQAISRRLSSFTNLKEVNFELIDSYEILENYNNLYNIRKESRYIRDSLIQQALDSDQGFISKRSIFLLLYSSFSAWMEFNKRKLSFLHKSEPLYEYLYNNPKNYNTWIRREKELIYWILNADILSDNEFKDICKNDISGALLRLIETSLLYILLMQSGRQIYDPLLYSYSNTIDTLRLGHFTKNIEIKKATLFDEYNLLLSRKARRLYFLPPHLQGDDLKRAIDKYEIIRKSLNRLDKTLKSISDEDLKYSLKDIIEEIRANIFSIKKISKTIEYAFWIAGFLNQLFPILLNPYILNKTNELLENKLLQINSYGLFACGFEKIAKEIINNQQLLKNDRNINTSFKLDKNMLDKHYEAPK